MGSWNASDSLSFEPSIHLLEKKPTNAMSTSQYAKANKKENSQIISIVDCIIKVEAFADLMLPNPPRSE